MWRCGLLREAQLRVEAEPVGIARDVNSALASGDLTVLTLATVLDADNDWGSTISYMGGGRKEDTRNQAGRPSRAALPGMSGMCPILDRASSGSVASCNWACGLLGHGMPQ